MIAKPEWMGPATIFAPLQATRCLKNREFRLYAYLVATDAAMKGNSFPNITTIADHFGWCTRTVNRGLARLFEQGFIVTTQSRNDGKFAHNHYHIADPQKSTVRQVGRANTAVRGRSAVSTGAVQVPIAERKPMEPSRPPKVSLMTEAQWEERGRPDNGSLYQYVRRSDGSLRRVDGDWGKREGIMAPGGLYAEDFKKRKSGYLRAAGLAA